MENFQTINIFSSHYPPHVGGVENFTQDLVEILSKDYLVNVVSSNSENRKFKEKINQKTNIFSLASIFKFFGDRFPIPYKLSELKQIYHELYKTDNNNLTIINTRFETTSLIGLWMAKKAKSKIILIEHGSAHLSVNNKIISFFIRCYEHIITFLIKSFFPNEIFYGVSRASLAWLDHFNIHADKKHLINGIFFDEEEKVKKEKNNNIEFIIFAAGRLLKEKGFLEIIEAINLLPENFQLKIAGFGKLEKDIKNFTRKNKKIIFLGKLTQNEIKKEIVKADLFINASKFVEGLPTILLQTGLTETPILTTINGGSEEIITANKTGFILKKVNSEEIKNQIIFIKNNYNLTKKYSQELKKKIIKEYNLKKNLENIINNL